MTLPKIKHVRAWFIGGANAKKKGGGRGYQEQRANTTGSGHIAKTRKE